MIIPIFVLQFQGGPQSSPCGASLNLANMNWRTTRWGLTMVFCTRSGIFCY